jgi:hypothetical protein
LCVQSVPGLVLSPLPFDVRFSFPRSGHDLWANSAILKKASFYFRTLLDSGLAESQGESCSYSGPKTEMSAATESSFEYSDEEDDGPATSPPSQQTLFSTVITDHAFRTYHAVWVWILTKHITFLPLQAERNTPPASTASSTSAGLEPPAKRRKGDSSSDTVPPVSPLAVYRLAHKLDLSELQDKALSDFRADLTVDNAARQLYSSTSGSYDDVREAAVKYVVKHWSKVKKTAGMREAEARVAARELDYGGVVSLALAKAGMAKSRG